MYFQYCHPPYTPPPCHLTNLEPRRRVIMHSTKLPSVHGPDILFLRLQHNVRDLEYFNRQRHLAIAADGLQDTWQETGPCNLQQDKANVVKS